MNACTCGYFRSLVLLLVTFFLIGPVSGQEAPAQTGRFVFDPSQSSIVQTGGFAGVNWTYTIQGRFCLIVDPDMGSARFEQVDANAIDDSEPPRSLDPNEAFGLTALVGSVLDDRTIEFKGQSADRSDVRLSLTFENDTIRLEGQTTPPPNTADFFLFRMDAVAERKYAGGTGQANTPYQIATAEDLIALGETPDDYDKHFILTADIDLDPNLPGGKVFDKAVIAPNTYDADSWNFFEAPFRGVFEGNGHTISNLMIEGDHSLGLFGMLRWPAHIRNVGLLDVNVEGSGATIASLAGSTAPYCFISDCYSTGTVSGDNRVGGLVGENGGSITRSYSTCRVEGISNTGGLVGANHQWYWDGNVEGFVTASFSDAAVSGRTNVGGLVGSNGGNVITSYSTSAVNGDSNVGGLAGANVHIGVSDSMSGAAIGTITESYSAGEVTGSENVGGLVGFLESDDITDSFWDIETSGQSGSSGATPKTTAEMQTASTFLDAGWDFVDEVENGPNDVWKIVEGKTYPLLSWQKYGGGTGEPNDPYLIYTAEHLNALGAEPNDYDKHFKLMADIDLSGHVYDRAVIAPDVNDAEQFFQGTEFAGTFNGNGYGISHLTVSGFAFVGLFGSFDPNATVSDMKLIAVNILGRDDYVGGLVGTSGCSITRISCTGYVEGSSYVGGLVGWNGGTIGTSSTSADVTGRTQVGGLVGSSGGSLSESHTTGSVDGYSFVGGLVGDNYGQTDMCYSTAVVTGGRWVGGLAGVNYRSIALSFSSGSVSGRDYVGGLVGGSGSSSSRISTSYSLSSVDGNTWVGGLVGESFGRISVSFSAGVVLGQEHVGGLSGGGGTYGDNASFWDVETSGLDTSDTGTGLTTAEMQTASTFLNAGWDFIDETENGTDDIWWILEGQDYPRLWWEREGE